MLTNRYNLISWAVNWSQVCLVHSKFCLRSISSWQMAFILAHSVVASPFQMLTVSSAKLRNILLKKFEEILFRWSKWTTFLQIFSNPHLMQMMSSAQQMMSSAQVWRFQSFFTPGQQNGVFMFLFCVVDIYFVVDSSPLLQIWRFMFVVRRFVCFAFRILFWLFEKWKRYVLSVKLYHTVIHSSISQVHWSYDRNSTNQMSQYMFMFTIDCIGIPEVRGPCFHRPTPQDPWPLVFSFDSNFVNTPIFLSIKLWNGSLCFHCEALIISK
jgi:hypothetical protein